MEDIRDFVAHFRRKNKFVGSEIRFAFGGENLEEKNCTNFFFRFLRFFWFWVLAMCLVCRCVPDLRTFFAYRFWFVSFPRQSG